MMDFDKLNKWLTLVANIGVLAGILFVGVELSQTQIAMQAESSEQRAQTSIDIRQFFHTYKVYDYFEKRESNEGVSADEYAAFLAWSITLLRSYENLHFQFSIGVLDEEIWESNLNALQTTCSDPGFKDRYPDWAANPISSRFRRSFSQLIVDSCYTD